MVLDLSSLKSAFRSGRPLCLALLTTLSVSIPFPTEQVEMGGHLLQQLRPLVEHSSAVTLVLFPALWVLYTYLDRLCTSVVLSARLCGGLLALLLLLGRCFEGADSIAPILASPAHFLVWTVIGLGYGVFFTTLINLLFQYLDHMAPGRHPSKRTPRLTKGQRYLLYTAILLAAWLPYLLLCYPGSVTYDGLYQLGQFFGAVPATNHHPWFATLLMGSVTRLGPSIPVGIFFYVLFQSLLCAGIYAGMCHLVRTQTDSRLWAAVALGYFALVPTWGSYAQMFVKDTIFCGVFSGFFLCLILLFGGKEQISRSVWVGLVAFGLLSCLLRGNGLYTVVPTLLVLAVVFKGWIGLRLGAFALAIALVWVGWNQTVLPAWGIAPGSSAEMLSLPFQQTARYTIAHGSELTEEEIGIIDCVLDYDVISTQYDPRVSDPVKATYHGDGQALGAYARLWLACGLRHPMTYFEAAWNQMFGYFLPGYRYGSYGGNYFQQQPEAYGLRVEFIRPNAVACVDQFSRLWSVTPVLGLLNSPGTHGWLLILATAALLRRRRFRALCVALPLWITLGICCISPVNGLVRYMLPIMAAMPLFLAFCGYTLRNCE